jgi:hypothetical protein
MLARLMPSTVRVKRRIAVGTQETQVLEAMVVVNAVDVIENQGHPLASPELALTAHLTFRAL